MKEICRRNFSNGTVYALETTDGMPVEVTDTFLPYYTKDAISRKQNSLARDDCGTRRERWMIGVSVMSGCPCGCKFCATGNLPSWRPLRSDEIVDQVEFILDMHDDLAFSNAKEHKINYTRMGEPFLNIAAVRTAIEDIEFLAPGTHHYVSTIGICGSDFSWIHDNITLQVSLHSLDETRRRKLIPFPALMSIEELGAIRTNSSLKTTLNMTLVDERDFDIDLLKRYFPKQFFFVKLSPINRNAVSDANGLGSGLITGVNLI